LPGKAKDDAPGDEEEQVADEADEVGAAALVVRGVLVVLVLDRVLARARDAQELAVLEVGVRVGAVGARRGAAPALALAELHAARVRRARRRILRVLRVLVAHVEWD
jgi:hypothetical protein